MAARPVRERRLPSALNDFIVTLPDSLKFKSFDRRLQNQIDRVANTKAKVDDIISKSGSKAVLRDCIGRLNTTRTEISDCLNNMSAMITEEDHPNFEDMADDIQHVIENTIDDIHSHLEERENESTVTDDTNTASVSRIPRHIESTPRFQRDFPDANELGASLNASHQAAQSNQQPAAPPNQPVAVPNQAGAPPNQLQPGAPPNQLQPGAPPNQHQQQGQQHPLPPNGNNLDDDDPDDSDYIPDEEYNDDDLTTIGTGSNLDISHQIVNTLDRIAAQSDLQTPSFIFDGSPWMYPRFVQDFERRVDSKSLTTSTKMHHLITATSGKARECIEMYQGMRGGYAKARALLKERFGQPYLIVQSCIARLTSTSRIKGNDNEAITRFADRLRSDYSLLNEMNLLGEANTQTTIKAIFDQLPPGMQGRWIREIAKIDPRQPSFKDMVEFVSIESKRISHPVYKVTNTSSNTTHGGGPRYDARPRPPRPSTFAHVPPSAPAASGSSASSSYRSSAASTYRPPTGPSRPRHSAPYRPPDPQRGPTDRNFAFSASARPQPDRHSVPSFGYRPPSAQPRPPDDSCSYCQRSGHEITSCPLFEMQNEETRRHYARDRKLCYTCLSSNHMTRACEFKDRNCTIRGCTGKHHRLLHQTHQQPAEPTAAESAQAAQNPPTEITGSIQRDNNSMLSSMPKVLLRVVPLAVRGLKGRSLTTFGLIDSGSTSTLMAKEFSLLLNLRGRHRQVSHDTVFASSQSVPVEISECQLMPLLGRSPDDNAIFDIAALEIVPQLHIDERYAQDNLDLSRWPHLSDICTKVQVDVPKITMLIGQDNPATQRILDTRYGSDISSQPYATLTPFGWTIAGPTRSSAEPNGVVACISKTDTCININTPECCPYEISDIKLILYKIEEAVKRLWNEERHGFSSDDVKTLSQNDKFAMTIMESSIRFDDIDGLYEIGMLRRYASTCFPDNYDMALRCLYHLLKRFAEDPVFAAVYRATIRDQIVQGIATKMTPAEARIRTPLTWHLTHHGVTNINKPDKVRVVKNAAAELKGMSLNNQLIHGPDLNNTLLGVSLRFRIGKVAINADIAAMFHRVKVTAADSESLRFLWWDDDQSTDEPPSTYKMTRHIFGATDSPCVCVFALQQCARDNAEDFDAETIQTILKNFYVDDLLKASPTVERAVFLAKQLIELLARGGFQLIKFVSNKPEVLAALPPDHVAPACREVLVDFDELPIQRALGIKWDINLDTFGVKITLLERPSTRRGCLSFVCAITDPFGAIAPVTLVAKQILQEACRRQLAWDDMLPSDLLNKWEKWKASLLALKEFSMPRCVPGLENIDYVKSVQLHNFSDASESGYGTASYLRVETLDGLVQTSLVMAKSRTQPLRFMSIPRAEFQAATISARVSRLLRRELDIVISDVYYWTDSTIALQYIRNTDRRFKTFIANRKEEILDCSDPSEWKYCATKLNPADLASRGVYGPQLMRSQLWLEGPPFLRLSPDVWPINTVSNPVLDEDPEVKTRSLIASVVQNDATVIDLFKHYSGWDRLVTAVAWIRKFIEYLKCKKTKCELKKTLLAADRISAAESIVRVAQRHEFGDEIKKVQKNLPVATTSRVRDLRPILVNGTLRVGGRLAEAPLSFEARHPMIVPKGHVVAKLLIRHYHGIVAHGGVQHTLSKLREKFWIPHAKSAIKSETLDCVICDKIQGQKMKQIMAHLPASRLTPYNPPFTVTGLDCFGPLLVKRGRTEVKRYGLIAVCFSVRAIHLETLETMGTDSFINALRRFIGRRGPAKEYYCDNGSNLVGGSRELRKAMKNWNHQQIERFLVQQDAAWHFQTPTASHMSGVWERLVKSAKLALKATLKNALVSEECLRTVLVEVEAVLNSRPITSNSDDIDDFEALTPNHHLLQRRVDMLPPGDFNDDDIYRRQWKQAQALSNRVWKRWIREYIPMLQSFAKWRRPKRHAAVGDLVLLAEDNVVRGKWPLGRIVSTTEGRDGYVRSVEVKTRTGTYKRPIHKLCLLEGARK